MFNQRQLVKFVIVANQHMNRNVNYVKKEKYKRKNLFLSTNFALIFLLF